MFRACLKGTEARGLRVAGRSLPTPSVSAAVTERTGSDGAKSIEMSRRTGCCPATSGQRSPEPRRPLSRPKGRHRMPSPGSWSAARRAGAPLCRAGAAQQAAGKLKGRRAGGRGCWAKLLGKGFGELERRHLERPPAPNVGWPQPASGPTPVWAYSSSLLPPRHASPGLNACGSRPSLTSCP
jgi:hypothetical protein